MTDELSGQAVHDFLTRLDGALRGEGFTTSWARPFWKWVRGPSGRPEPEPTGLRQELFVADLPMQKVAPFDFSEVRVMHLLGRIRFSLTVYFRDAIEKTFSPEDYDAVFETHDRFWIVWLNEYFSDLEERYGLQWDLEGDDMIEDSLYGDFRPEEADRIVSLLGDIRSLSARWPQ